MTPSGRNTGAAANKEGRETRSGVFAAPPSGLVIGTPPHAGVGKAAAWSNRANRTDDMVAPWDEPIEEAASAKSVLEYRVIMQHPMSEFVTASSSCAVFSTRRAAETNLKGQIKGNSQRTGRIEVWRNGHKLDAWQENQLYDATCGMMPTEEWLAAMAVIDLPPRTSELIVAYRVLLADKNPDKTSATPLTNMRDISADKKPAILPQSLQSPSEVLVDAAIAKQKAAKGTSRLEELKDGIRDGVVNFDERKDADGRVALFDDIYLARNTMAFVVKHPENPNSVVVAVPGRDGKPELCKDTTDELTVFLMRIRDGQKKVQHKALATVNEVEVKTGGTDAPAVGGKLVVTPLGALASSAVALARPAPATTTIPEGYPAWLVREIGGRKVVTL